VFVFCLQDLEKELASQARAKAKRQRDYENSEYKKRNEKRLKHEEELRKKQAWKYQKARQKNPVVPKSIHEVDAHPDYGIGYNHGAGTYFNFVISNQYFTGKPEFEHYYDVLEDLKYEKEELERGEADYVRSIQYSDYYGNAFVKGRYDGFRSRRPPLG
jgi:hypothetical protein